MKLEKYLKTYENNTFIILLFVSLTSFAHRGNFLAINNVEITETEKSYIYSFAVENINSVEVRDIKIEFVVNSKSVFQKYYPLLKAEHKYFSMSSLKSRRNGLTQKLI